MIISWRYCFSLCSEVFQSSLIMNYAFSYIMFSSHPCAVNLAKTGLLNNNCYMWLENYRSFCEWIYRSFINHLNFYRSSKYVRYFAGILIFENVRCQSPKLSIIPAIQLLKCMSSEIALSLNIYPLNLGNAQGEIRFFWLKCQNILKYSLTNEIVYSHYLKLSSGAALEYFMDSH